MARSRWYTIKALQEAAMTLMAASASPSELFGLYSKHLSALEAEIRRDEQVGGGFTYGDTSTRWMAWMAWYNLFNTGILLTRHVIDNVAIPKKSAKAFEMAARIFRVRYGRGKGPRPSIASWYEKNKNRLKLLEEAKDWPTRTEADDIHRVGPFSIHNTIGASEDDIEAAKRMVMKALGRLPDTGLSVAKSAAYGDVFLVGEIARKNWAAWYEPKRDVIYLRPKVRGLSEEGTVKTLIHELGHRIWAKHVPIEVKRAWTTHHRRMLGRNVADVPVVPGDVLPFMVNRKTVSVGPTTTRGEMTLIDVKTSLPIGTVPAYKVKMWLAEVARKEKFPSIYAAKSEEEHFCEALAYKAVGALSEENLSAFDTIVVSAMK